MLELVEDGDSEDIQAAMAFSVGGIEYVHVTRSRQIRHCFMGRSMSKCLYVHDDVAQVDHSSAADKTEGLQ